MRTMRLPIVTIVLVMSTGILPAQEAYRLVKVWPEAPRGWHFFKPTGIAVDKAGNVYVGDGGNYCVKKFDAEGRFITQWGSPGLGDGQFNTTIANVKVDGSGIVYVFDNDLPKGRNFRIQKFTPYGQFLGTLERKTPDANIVRVPVDLAVDNEGNILVLAADYGAKTNQPYGGRIEKYSQEGRFISQWGAEAGSGDGQLQRPHAIAVDSAGNIYVAEIANGRVQKFDSSGKFLTKWGALGSVSREGDGLFRAGARSIAVDKTGNICVLDFNSIQKFTPTGQFLARWKTSGQLARRLAIDSGSNIYMTCENSHEVIKLDANGKVVSRWGCVGTGGVLSSVPGSIAINRSDRPVVADVWNGRILKFTSEGQLLSQWGGEISPGVSTWAWVWDLATDTDGNIYCANTDEVQKYNREGKLIGRWGGRGSGDGQFQCAAAVAVDPSGHVYVADDGNSRVQKFSREGKFLAKWGTKGIGEGQFDGMSFIAADSSGNVWVTDRLERGTHRMQKFDANGRLLATWVRKMKMLMPPRPGSRGEAMAVDFSGNSYYPLDSRIEKYNAQGDLISTYGQGEFSKVSLGRIWAVCVDRGGCVYVTGPADPCDSSVSTGGSIRKFDADGRLVHKWTVGRAEGIENFPSGPIAVDGAGTLYASHDHGSWITKLSAEGKRVAQFRVAAPQDGHFSILGGVAVDPSGKVYAVDSVDVAWSIPSIKQFDPNGQLTGLWDVPEEAKDRFKYPALIAMDSSGNAYVTDSMSHCVHKLGPRGKYITSWGSKGAEDGQFDTPEGIAVDGSGHVFVCDRQNSRIQKFDSDGKFLAKWGKEGSGDGEFHFAAAVAVDNKGNVFVADSDNHRIQKFTAEGKFLTKWGQFGEAPGQFNVPLGIAVDTEGSVYVSDSHNHRIQKFAPAAAR